MQYKKQIKGTCHICGEEGELTYEHIPPRAAFNNKRVIRLKFQEVISLGPDEIVKGPVQQRGVGAYTLCPRCNNYTGLHYAPRFIDWCYQGMGILMKSNGNPTSIHLSKLYPLSIIKEIAVMFFSVNPDTFRKVNPELVRFVLDREAKYLPSKYRFYVYFNIEGKLRFMGITASVNVFKRTKPIMISEITYPPYGYVMTIDSEKPDPRLFEITSFAGFNYNEFKVMTLKLPVLPTHLVFPGDYRTKQEILEQAAQPQKDN